MVVHRTKNSAICFKSLLILSALIVITPMIKAAWIYSIMGLFLVVYALLHIAKDGHFHKNTRLGMCVCVYMLICIIYKTLGVSSVTFGALSLHLFFFICILAMLLLPNIISEGKGAWVFWVIVIIMLLNILDNIRLCVLYPEIYILVNRDSDSDNINALNIGSSRFYNAVFFFYMICFYGFLNCKGKKSKICLFTSAIIAACFIFGFCLKASVLVFTFLATVLLYFARGAASLRKFSFQIIVPALLGYAFVSVFSDYIIELISNLFANERLAQRLMFLIDSDEGSRAAGTVNAREGLWQLSFNTWTDNLINFFVGIGDHRVVWGEQSPENVGIGQHSDFFDSLARYGLLGMSLLITIFSMGFKYLCSFFRKECKIQLYVIFLIFLLFSITKGVFFPDIGFLLFVLLPLLAGILSKQSKIKDIK